MSDAVYLLCALTSAGCATLLLRSWAAGRVPLLLWSGLCFVGLTINNLLLVVDLTIVEDTDLSLLRQLSAFISVSILLVGLIWESK